MATNDIYTFNEKYDKSKYFRVIFGDDLEKEIKRLFEYPKNFRVKRMVTGNVLTTMVLKKYKRTFSPENCYIHRYRIEIVGDKRKTTHLPAGKLIQFFDI